MVLALTMVLAYVPFNTFATESENEFVAAVNGTQYESLQAAVEAAQPGDTITVIADHKLTWDEETFADGSLAAMVVVEGKAVTIDLNGKNLTADSTGINLYAVFAADNGGSLTLKGDGSVTATGTGFTASGTTA